VLPDNARKKHRPGLNTRRPEFGPSRLLRTIPQFHVLDAHAIAITPALIASDDLLRAPTVFG
jgi:hypothetical protein